MDANLEFEGAGESGAAETCVSKVHRDEFSVGAWASFYITRVRQRSIFHPGNT